MLTNFSAHSFGDYGNRTLLRVTGPDAVTFLHNLCTQDIRSMKPGDCSEAFITNVQGKTLGYVRVFRLNEGAYLECSPGEGPALLAHFDKYQIREKVEFLDLSKTAHGFVASWGLVDSFTKEMGQISLAQDRFVLCTESSPHFILARWEIAGPESAFVITIDHEGKSQWLQFALSLEAQSIPAEELQANRISAGTIEFGSDVTSENLPQELTRDSKTISFTKGCYLGQETVARIDALGHVNRLLIRLRGAGKLPIVPGDAIFKDGKQVGQITSSAYWDSKKEHWAMGFVRRGNQTPGTMITVNDASLEVVG